MAPLAGGQTWVQRRQEGNSAGDAPRRGEMLEVLVCRASTFRHHPNAGFWYPKAEGLHDRPAFGNTASQKGGGSSGGEGRSVSCRLALQVTVRRNFDVVGISRISHRSSPLSDARPCPQSNGRIFSLLWDSRTLTAPDVHPTRVDDLGEAADSC